MRCVIIFFNDTATTEIYTLSLHDALPICPDHASFPVVADRAVDLVRSVVEVELEPRRLTGANRVRLLLRSEEHMSELQSRQYLVCRLLFENKNRYSCLSCLSPVLLSSPLL